jgi:glycerophosphoryl diester phosphodiesterase
VLSHDEPVGGEVTLDEAFAKISTIENLQVNVDVKTCIALQKVHELAIKHNVEHRIFFTGINEEDVKAVNEQYPAIEYYLNMKVKKPFAHTDAYLQSLVDKVKECGAIGINFQYRSASKRLVEYFHKNGLLVSIFTVDSKPTMYKILSYGPDNITTRNPDVFQTVLKEF